jgi:hypothetical protein
MYFQVLQVVLWPKDGYEKRIVKFDPGVVNVISGLSKTGKSAIIPIIDYCLGSDKCAIPVGVIRDKCGWFGVVVETIEGQKLLARREPGDQQQTGDMFILEAPEVEIPDVVSERNSNTTVAKTMLDRLAGLTTLGFDPENENIPYRSRPSFRDLMAFTFQPQNIIANPDVMFFKADTTEHREKLKTIFPYILNAVTTEVLAARWEIDRLQRLHRRKEAELRAAMGSIAVWRNEALAWLRQAKDLGLLPVETPLPSEWPDILDLLRRVAASSSRLARPSISSIDSSLVRLEELRNQEASVAAELSEHRQRLNEIHRLIQSSASYGSAIRVQRDRLALSKWLRTREAAAPDVLAALGNQGHDDLDALVAALEGIEIQLQSHPTLSDTLDREIIRRRGLAEHSLEILNTVRREIADLERDSIEAREAAYRSDQIERFIGRLEQALTLYDKADENAELREQIRDILGQIQALQSGISESEIRRRIENALRTIETAAASIIPGLDAEWPEAPIKLIIDDLTIKVLQGTRDDYLWEIGSGANWLAYHVALTLALQRFFLSLPHHPVPSFVVYDQPSQVYFPKRTAGKDEITDPAWRDEDVVAVRKVFSVLAIEVRRALGRLQIIVLDHAGSEVWGDLDGVVLTEEWRGDKLVPEAWV